MSEKDVKVAVSILTADFLNLKNDLDQIIKAKIPIVHFDVMDNNFVPNLSFGPKILNDVASYLKDKNVVVDCHLMVKLEKNVKVKDFLQPFIINNVNNICLHYEALTKKQLIEFLNWKNCKFKKGIAISPQTKINKIFPYLKLLDLVLIMSVNPGFGNQKFIVDTYQKIKNLSMYCRDKTFDNLLVAVDGGINNSNARECVAVGANYLVSGSYLLNSDNSIKKQLEELLS